MLSMVYSDTKLLLVSFIFIHFHSFSFAEIVLLSDFVVLYDYVARMTLCHLLFNSPGSTILWCPQTVSRVLQLSMLLIDVYALE